MTKLDIIKELTSWEVEFSEAMILFEEDTKNQTLKEISKRYGGLKKRITERLKELKRMDSQGKLDEQEKYFLLPAMTDVFLHCNARIGSMNKQELSFI